MLAELQEKYAHLFEDELLEEMNQVATFKEIKAGDKLIDFGAYVRSMPLIVSGAIKVLREDENGDELLLYFIEAGETCAMTMTCCLGNTKSEVRAIAELDSKLIMLPVQKMEEWMGKYKSWRNFVLNSYQARMTELLNTIDKIAFLKMDERLLNYLEEKVKVSKDKFINSTHQEIAYELNTSRVVISRLLKRLENDGLIELQRNRIKVLAL
ncbi:MAG: Crp/Fnr family transcriptional regulator [Flavobacteriales bacterium]|nr:Crp/Fnr family transcriptional regulator [Flavobacteriales bacterium]|tara:strand:- start:67827 stop:68459 length:633 start_codon:yes stop_codon:yes gene_type:complete